MVFLREMQDSNIPGMIFIGPPGTAKSALFFGFLQSFPAARKFVTLITRFAKDVSGRRRATTEELMRDWALGRGMRGGAQ